LDQDRAIVAVILISVVLLPTNLELVFAQEKINSQTEPFVQKTIGILFEEHFESGRADGWSLDPGWLVERDPDGFVLSGSQHSWAVPLVSGWTDYEIHARVKLLSGSFHFNVRCTLDYMTRYFVHVGTDGLGLSKQIDQDFFDLVRIQPGRGALERDRWYVVKIALNRTEIKVYVDGDLKIRYVDEDLPIRVGGVAFETLDDSHVHFDDIVVTGVRLEQRSTWIKTGGPPGGLGYDVRIHPRDKRIMFVTDNPSGVQKSYDGGETWIARNTGITSRAGPSLDGIPNFSVTIDPNDPNIVWAGTQSMRGIYKSTDGGETWFKKDEGVTEWNEITLRGFGVRPGNSSIVFAAAEITTGILGSEFDKAKGKIYKTEDGGEHWFPVWAGDSLARVIIFDPTNPDTVYASTGIFDREAYNEVGIGILKSTDGGMTWRQINNGIRNLFIGFLEMHPTNPKILFAAAGNNAPPWNKMGAIYRTLDGGEHWTEVLSKATFTVVTISPSNPNVIYAGSEVAFYRSDDGGNTWQKFNKPSEGCYGPPGIRAGFPISAVVDPNDPMTIFANNYSGGVFKSTDGARTWVDASKGYTGADLRDIVVDPYTRETVYTIGRSGPYRSYDGGANWEGLAFSPASEAEWYAVALNPQNAREVIIGDEFTGSIYKSTNGGYSWKLVFKNPEVNGNDPLKRHGFKTIAYAPSDPSIIYAGMRIQSRAVEGDLPLGPSFGVYKSVNGGETWSAMNSGLDSTTKNINDVIVDPDNPDVAYVATLNDGVFKTINGGRSWLPKSNGLMSLDARSLAMDPKNSSVLYAGLGEGAGIFKSTDGAESWVGINYGITVECPSYLQRIGQVRPGISLVKPKRLTTTDYYARPWTIISGIVIDPTEPQTLYAADQFLGIYMSTDGGETWISINDGLHTRATSALAVSGDGGALYAATMGEGVFRLDIKQSEETNRTTTRTVPTNSSSQSAPIVTHGYLESIIIMAGAIVIIAIVAAARTTRDARDRKKGERRQD